MSAINLITLTPVFIVASSDSQANEFPNQTMALCYDSSIND